MCFHLPNGSSSHETPHPHSHNLTSSHLNVTSKQTHNDLQEQQEEDIGFLEKPSPINNLSHTTTAITTL